MNAYAELHCKTNFSFLTGASHADELCARAAELGYSALAITDEASLAGVVKAHAAAKAVDLKLIIGAEIALQDSLPVVLWAPDRQAYGRLSRLLTLGRRRAEKGKYTLTFNDLAAHAAGLLAGVLPTPRDSAVQMSHDDLAHELGRYRETFPGRCYLLAELTRGPDDSGHLATLAQLARRVRLPLVAAGDVHYHTPARQPLAEVLAALRHGVTVAELGRERFPNAERHLRPLEEIAALFAAAPGAMQRTQEIADRCTFSLAELRYEYPEELAPPGLTPLAYLTELTWAGAARRYPAGVSEKVRQAVEHELALIADLKYEAYFLTVYDLVRFARERGILCQGRGSAANSAVCYCLEVTAVDPQHVDLLFERFVSRERNEAPDIDVDFEHERREEVLQYVYEKYGRERAGLTAVVITYRARSAIRDVGRALGLAAGQIDFLAQQVEGCVLAPAFAGHCAQAGLAPQSPLGARFLHLTNELIGFPRHLSQHVGGMVITRGLLSELAPIENAAMPGRTVIEWNKDDLDELGILKIDCLALGMLTAIRKCFALVERHWGPPLPRPVLRERAGVRVPLTLASVPTGDPAVYDMICRADTLGVFQIESRAQMSMLPRLKPRCYYDLVIEVALVRPGPIQGQMVHPYLRRRAGEEEVSYPSEAIEAVLERTLGVPIFQEQAMRLAVVAAGFTPGEADQLRRAMGAWRRPGIIDKFHVKLIDGMLERGLSREFAEQVFTQIRGFGEYGFPESHAASFALLVYISAWLKHYYPAAYTAAIINSQPMGFYAPAQLVRDARDHGIEVRPVDVNASDWDCTLEPPVANLSPVMAGLPTEPPSRPPLQGLSPLSRFGRGAGGEGPEFHKTAQYRQQVFLPSPASGEGPGVRASASNSLALRLGFRLLVGFSERHARAIVAARAEGPFCSVADLAHRARLSQAVLKQLAEADALASLARDRRQMLWETLAQESQPRVQPLFHKLAADDEPAVSLPALDGLTQVFADYRTAGLSLRGHPLDFWRAELNRLRVTPAQQLAQLSNNRYVRVAGLVILRQRPGTAKGITFVTLEDETGSANLVVHQATWDRFHLVARGAPAWIAHGRLERRESVIHVIVQRLEDLSEQLRALNVKSRDFR